MEVPVEKIVEKTIEVKVEVPVEKEIYLTDDSKVDELIAKVKELETERDNYKQEAKDFETKWNETLEKLREELKKKNKRDLYGE